MKYRFLQYESDHELFFVMNQQLAMWFNGYNIRLQI